MSLKFKLYKWSKKVRKRDAHRCTECGATENLSAHHIVPRNERPDLALSLRNGKTLCHGCHEATHRRYDLYRTLWALENSAKLTA